MADIRPELIGKPVFPSTKPLEVTLEYSKTAVVYNHLFFIDFNDLGESIIGTSNISGTFWEGSLLHFKDDKQLEDLAANAFYVYTTTSDAKFLTDDTIALAEDTGTLSILKVSEYPLLQPVMYFKTGQRIPQIAVWKNSSKILACSGRCINIFDISSSEKKDQRDFRNIHMDTINSLDTLPNDYNTFVSASSDRKACIWDLRLANPASVLYANEFSSLTSIACNKKDDNYVIVGLQSGDIYAVDKRVPKDFVSQQTCFDHSVYRIAINEKGQIAVCGDTHKVVASSFIDNTLRPIYINEDHSEVVRCVRWYKDTLYTCGFDKRVLKHVL